MKITKLEAFRLDGDHFRYEAVASGKKQRYTLFASDPDVTLVIGREVRKQDCKRLTKAYEAVAAAIPDDIVWVGGIQLVHNSYIASLARKS